MHTSGILFAPAFAWLVLSTPQWKRSHWPLVGPMFLLFLAGLTPFVYLSLRASAQPVIDYSRFYSGIDLTTLSGLWWMISGKAYSFFAFAYTWQEIPAELLRFASYLWRNYLGIGVVLGAIWDCVVMAQESGLDDWPAAHVRGQRPLLYELSRK